MGMDVDWAFNKTLELLKANIEASNTVVKPEFVIDFIDKVFVHLKNFDLNQSES